MTLPSCKTMRNLYFYDASPYTFVTRWIMVEVAVLLLMTLGAGCQRTKPPTAAATPDGQQAQCLDATTLEATYEQFCAREKGSDASERRRYEKACDDEGDADACAYVGHAFATGCSDVSTSQVQALKYYQRACRGESGEGCAFLAVSYLRARDERSLARAAEYFRRSCSLGYMGGCLGLGQMYEFGAGVAQDKARAYSIYKSACNAGEPASCNNVGNFHKSGTGRPVDHARATRAFVRACDCDYLPGCNNLALNYSNGWGVEQDISEAAQIWARICDAGHAKACSNLGTLSDGEDGRQVDRDRAVQLYTHACEEGAGVGCHNLGMSYLKGEGVSKDVSRSVPLFEKGCALNFADACKSAGHRHTRGEGTPVDYTKGNEFYERACKLGSAKGCTYFGQNLYEGRGVDTPDPERAQRLFRHACEAGDDSACTKHEELSSPR